MPNANPAPAAQKNVLLVEDQALLALMVEEVLAEGGYRTAWSPDGRSGPAASERAAADASAAVVDLRLANGSDGRQVVRELRERRPALPVVVLTGFHPEAPQADLRGLGGPTLRMLKPFDPDVFLDGLSEVLRASAVGVASVPRRRASDALLEAA
jgi:DNA-binding response OmpR family regulator